MSITSDLDALLDVWFPTDLDSRDQVAASAAIWFGGDSSFDRLLEGRFVDVPDSAAEICAAYAPSHPTGWVSLVLALDQLPRNLYRGTSRSFEYDPLALKAALRIVGECADEALHPVMAAFVYLPFEHAEDPAYQEQSVVGFRGLLARAPTALHEQFAQFLQYSERHQAVIEEFGRFPHRNDLLGRVSTEAETAYLRSGGETFQ